MGENFAQRVLETCDRRGTAPAVWEPGATDPVSHTEFARRVRKGASALVAAGVIPGDRVAIVQRNTVDHVVDWFAALAAGALVVDVSFLLGAEEHAHILDDAAPRVLLTDPDLVDPRSVPKGTTRLESHLEDRPGVADVASRRVADDPAVIAYTSGTTGLPKGVVHTHGALARQIDLLHKVCGYDAGWTAYVAIPLFSMHGFLPQVAATLAAGGDVVLDDKFEVTRLSEMSHRHRFAYTTLSSPMIPRLLGLNDDDRPDLSSIRLVSCGGAPLHPDVRSEFEQTFGIHLTQGYSCTEVVGAFVMDVAGDAPSGAAGRVYPASTSEVVRIIAADGRPAAVGERGEIQFHRDFAMAGYWGLPAETDDAFVDGDWYATGDIGVIDADGFLAVVDRKKDVIIRGGFNIYSAEIERVLVQHEAVAEATVIARPDPSLGEVPVAFVVLDGAAASEADLREFVRQRLGPLKQVEAVSVVAYDELPRNGLGKVLKNELRASLRPSVGSG